MAVTYTWDVYSTLDGFASYTDGGDWGGYWGKQGPELLAHRSKVLGPDQRLVLGANTFRQFVALIGPEKEHLDAVNQRMWSMPTTVVSTSIKGAADWPDATIEPGDALNVVARLKQTSPVPLRSHGSLSMNRALMAAGLVDRLQVTIFPVVSGQTGQEPVFGGASDFDLEMIGGQMLDGRTQELIYRPSLHR